MSTVFYILLIATVIQLFYFFFFYLRIVLVHIPSTNVVGGDTNHVYKDKEQENPEPVSIIVCAHNELENLKRLVPLILQQQYKNFELLVADDRSTDGSFDYFRKIYADNDRFKIIRMEENKEGENFKKHALTKAIEAAKFEILLLTDADCIPASDYWVASMIASLEEGKEIVLGYSPYAYRNGWLNVLIRYETLHTAVQYFSFTLAGLPYMGVGRNLLYKKTIFERNKGFNTHITTMGGDDDLFIREVAKKETVGICMNKEAQMISVPKGNYLSWFKQKRRHLSVGPKYRLMPKFLLGLEMLSHIVFYISLGTLFCINSGTAFLFLMTRSLVFVVIFALIARKLGDKYTWWWLLLPIDIVYIFNNLIIAFSLVIDKKIKWS